MKNETQISVVGVQSQVQWSLFRRRANHW